MDFQDLLATNQPVLLFLNHGESLNADLNKALESAAQSGLQVLKINVDEQPDYAQQFGVGKHPVLAMWHCGEIVAKRSRPWGPEAVEMVQKALSLGNPSAVADEKPAKAAPSPVATDKTVAVSDATFKELVLESPLPVLVDFWAAWCGPCRAVAPILDKLAKEFAGRVRIAKVDVDANPALAQAFRIQSIPTLMFVKNGKIVGQSAGAAPEPALRQVMNDLIALVV